MSQSSALGDKTAFESPDDSPPPLEALPSAPQRSLSSIQPFLMPLPSTPAPQSPEATSSIEAISTPPTRGIKRERSRDRPKPPAYKQEEEVEAAEVEAITPSQLYERPTVSSSVKRPASNIKVKQQQQPQRKRSHDDEEDELLFDVVPKTHRPPPLSVHPAPSSSSLSPSPSSPRPIEPLPHLTTTISGSSTSYSPSTALVPSNITTTTVIEEQEPGHLNAEFYCAVCRVSVPLHEQRTHLSSIMHMFQTNLTRTPAPATENDQKALIPRSDRSSLAPRPSSRPSSSTTSDTKPTNKLTKGAKRQLRKNMQNINKRLDEALRNEFAGLYRMGPG